MKQLLVNSVKLLYTLIKYLKTVISYRIAFLITALKYNRCFDLSCDDDDNVNIVFHE